MSLCVPQHRSALPKKEHVSVFLGVSYTSHMTQMAAAGNADFDRNLFLSTILTLNELLDEEIQKPGTKHTRKEAKELLLVTIS